ncbi:MAG: hypothetical protein CMN37_04945 [SAR116 cluster bacterium]|nr:hypothetical protein [SAR116 cluster bacterium]
MRKILLTTVGVTALAVSANATDFTLSGTAKVKVADDGNTSVDVSTAIGVSKTFDNGMVLSLSNNNMGNAGELTVKSDAISVTFGDYDQNEKNPGLNGNAASADIVGDGITAANHSNAGAISLGATVAGMGIGAAMNNDGDTMFGASFTTDMGGMAMTIGGDVHSDNTSSADETAMGVKATIGSLVVVANSVQKEAAAGVDVTTYSAAYTTGGLVIGFQGADNDASSYSATYTIVPGMQFEIGSLDNGTTSTSSAELQMTF